MIIIEFDDGSQMSEGTDFTDWAQVPRDKKIRGLMITAGGQFRKILTGFDMYMAEFESVQKTGFTLDIGSGQYVPTSIGEPEVVCQKVHCIKYAGPHRQRLSKFVQDEIAELDKALAGANPTVTRALLVEKERLLIKQKDITEGLAAREVVTFTLALSASVIDRNHLPVNKSMFREGVPADDSEQWFEGLRPTLERKNLKLIKEVKPNVGDNN